jgi:dTDP-4-dehydrorhamnose 3,5-epimerase
MIFTETKIKGAFIIDLEPRGDHRGAFSRAFCSKEFEAQGLTSNFVQTNYTVTYKKGTLRGLHYQVAPACEAKLIRCVKGAIYDFIVDLRPESPTYLQSFGVELTAENRRSFYFPEMCAHGYQALTDDAEAIYQASAFYTPECERGVRYNDPAFKIELPTPVTEISEKDSSWSLYEVVPVGVSA